MYYEALFYDNAVIHKVIKIQLITILSIIPQGSLN